MCGSVGFVHLSTAVTYCSANGEKPPEQIYKCDYSPLSAAGNVNEQIFFMFVKSSPFLIHVIFKIFAGKKKVLHQEGDLCSFAFFHVVKRRVLLQTASKKCKKKKLN